MAGNTYMFATKYIYWPKEIRISPQRNTYLVTEIYGFVSVDYRILIGSNPKVHLNECAGSYV